MFSEELAKISWDDTTAAIASKTENDVRIALAKERLNVAGLGQDAPRRGRLHGAHLARRRALSRTDGSQIAILYTRAIRQDYQHVHPVIPQQRVLESLRLLWI